MWECNLPLPCNQDIQVSGKQFRCDLPGSYRFAVLFKSAFCQREISQEEFLKMKQILSEQ
ncbi:MAG: hypothetical protein VR64_04220 [Desulfatitalea sp. BRH_c12]|nr:MAG: hypothetical protein VR64_04220 [Desulfatitalea sp. BRH_c12]